MRIDLKDYKSINPIIKMVTGHDLFGQIKGVTTDSREAIDGDLYIALEGSVNDGHSYLEEVDALNVAAVLINKNKGSSNLKAQKIEVTDTKKTLGDISKEWRRKFDIPVIGITGSNGKTSTKDLLYHVLKKKYNVHLTRGNYNTSIGLPLTMLEINDSHEISIVEMGANQVGDIEYLCALAKPTHGLITNVSSAHLEGFGNIDNIIKTKGALFEALKNGVSFVNYADDKVKNAHKLGKKITYGLNEICDFPADIHHDEDGSIILTIDSQEIHTQSQNLSFAKNIIAVASIAITLGIKWNHFQERILSYQPPKGRCEVSKYDKITVIDDTYNSNLESCSAAIDYLKAFSGKGRKIVVLGDMLELGKASEEQHIALGYKCSSSNLDAIFTLGENAFFIKKSITGIQKNHHFEVRQDLIDSLKLELKDNDTILFKGSRGMKMEKIIEGVFEK
ncbi:UDP-N-acetylmuramoyl-tripeptide--D-alanyl-D-alanine ligase [bacterium]|jgi:UDP-N-acetylmuramoyl-tripeptide--D-alanyl-D-alanine ligase|nr:UDP-N-acetylmuramoyl-tripeptide--D-alanyl-D-alanine ligase [bacterium]MBT4928030.1 UDP-N-acetylmuramoyl-tripeptide--D-alanyl-D-alanine ligase [bacterium]MBT5733531.1 UDP-N-acetylmuramoyl-tripeptide--D-alanyl-D-alanine ligase [bacterium]MBT6018999.1 UDP-N-acetylmuramoyl-tripeptide--D-alanyl-D-alanine ligase [bacterium]